MLAYSLSSLTVSNYIHGTCCYWSNLQHSLESFAMRPTGAYWRKRLGGYMLLLLLIKMELQHTLALLPQQRRLACLYVIVLYCQCLIYICFYCYCYYYYYYYLLHYIYTLFSKCLSNNIYSKPYVMFYEYDDDNADDNDDDNCDDSS